MLKAALLCFIIWVCIVQDITTKHAKTYLVETESDEVQPLHVFKRSGINSSGHGSDYIVGDQEMSDCPSWSDWGQWSGGNRCGSRQSRSKECKCAETVEVRDLSCARKDADVEGFSKVPCSLWSEWSQWSGSSGCGSKQTRKKDCRCAKNIPTDNCSTTGLVETRLGACSKKGPEHGSDYGNPSRYGGDKPELTTLAPKQISCEWGNWSKWGGANGCGEQESRGRFCKCSNGTYGDPGQCGGGSTEEERQGSPCEKTSKGTPKPYRKRKRRM